jgi:hypothetical protein
MPAIEDAVEAAEQKMPAAAGRVDYAEAGLGNRLAIAIGDGRGGASRPKSSSAGSSVRSRMNSSTKSGV